ncbi:S49 family peptidase [bacterium]|nr:S49 family peptidase [bacterium]
MRALIPVLVLISLAAALSHAGTEHGLADPLWSDVHLASPPGAAGGAAGAFANPAAWAAAGRTSSAFWWNDANRPDHHLDNWGLSIGRRLGLAVRHATYPTGSAGFTGVTDWQVGLAGGDRRHYGAIAWRWSTGGGAEIPREKALAVGQIWRPGRALAVGLAGVESMESDARHGSLDLALRPFGQPWFTVFGDYVLRGGETLDGGRLGGGLTVQPLPGLRLGLRLREDPAGDDRVATYSLGLTLGRRGFTALPTYDADSDRLHTTYLLETDAPRAPIPDAATPRLYAPPARVVALDLEGRRLTYQKYRWFDDTRLPWLDLSRVLDAIGRDDQVAGLALNLAGFSGRPSLLWELRERLAVLREAGKEIFIHLDRSGMFLYALASVADHVTVDPEGMLQLPGLDLSRTYMRDLLDKLGLGFAALQYFDHKTAVESLSRQNMSDADREQRGRIVDVVYEWMREATCDGRDLAPAEFDRVVDDEMLLFADEAAALGLIDGVARWHELGDWLAEHRGAALVGPDASLLRVHNDERWGLPPSVAVVYAVGVCDMETGIKGRATARYLRALIDDPDVAAVVLRADSPGGDPLPSDLVAEAVSMLREAGKPVVVSQGDVAASGGYWISMNGTEILTTPVAITGSIGVIGGWVWDERMHEKAGLDADGVSRGKHADLGRSVRYPIGFAVPYRDLSEEEYDFARERILTLYDRFVAVVAAERDLTVERVRELGGGRVWMGGDAVDRGLCDGIGGLTAAIARARELAGFDPADEVLLREYPPRPWLEWPDLRLPFLGLNLKLPAGLPAGLAASDDQAAPESPEMAFLRAIAASRGAPCLLLAPDLLPEAWR